MYNTPIMRIGIILMNIQIHRCTIKKYEKLGFIKPFKLNDTTKLYSIKDFDKICFIIFLTKEHHYKLSKVKDIFDLLEKNNIKPNKYYHYFQKNLLK